MRVSKSEPGLLVSAAVHGGAFALLLFGFLRPPAFPDAAESLPIETITQSQFDQVTKGEKTAKLKLPDAKPHVDKIDPVPKPTEKRPLDEAKRDVAPPPPKAAAAPTPPAPPPQEVATAADAPAPPAPEP
ncbi:MAG: cell envelope biogenesis protein TolA, partial [Hyphomicrobiales bacterium]|nr:cell envelope biogenesis protein TolA [Hyphomicrobiales bacterium]